MSVAGPWPGKLGEVRGGRCRREGLAWGMGRIAWLDQAGQVNHVWACVAEHRSTPMFALQGSLRLGSPGNLSSSLATTRHMA
eukprot:5159190-Alexandrium_andersonii.AAC.1